MLYRMEYPKKIKLDCSLIIQAGKYMLQIKMFFKRLKLKRIFGSPSTNDKILENILITQANVLMKMS